MYYSFPLAPSITSINPTSGNAGQFLTGVSISGSNFDSNATLQIVSGSYVLTPSNVSVNTSTGTITFNLNIPNNVPRAPWDIVVTNPNSGFSGTGYGKFYTYNPNAPTISDISITVPEDNPIPINFKFFNNSFSDQVLGETLIKVKFQNLPSAATQGQLMLGNTPVVANTDIATANLNNLRFPKRD